MSYSHKEGKQSSYLILVAKESRETQTVRADKVNWNTAVLAALRERAGSGDRGESLACH